MTEDTIDAPLAPPPAKRGRPRKEPPQPAPDPRFGQLGHNIGFEPPPEEVARLSRDLANAGRTLSIDEARFLVDAYYQMQRDRIRADHQARTLSQGSEPADLLAWLGEQRHILEKQVARALDRYSDANAVGRWSRSIDGIGPIIAAGLIAHLDISHCPTAGHLWRFAGLDPTVEWGKGQKRPWNGALKRLCFLIGESFTKISNKEGEAAYYGHIYRGRKAMETAKNERLEYKDQAEASLAKKRFGADTDARKHYEAGRLPPARIHLRAQRYAVKRFLSDLQTVAYWNAYSTLPRFPWVIEHGGHTHYVRPPCCPDDLLSALHERGSVIEPSEAEALRSQRW